MKALMLSGEQLWRREPPVRVKYGDLEQTGRKEAMASVQSANHPRRLNHQGQKTNKKKPYVPQGPVKVDNDDDDMLSKSPCHLHLYIFFITTTHSFQLKEPKKLIQLPF